MSNSISVTYRMSRISFCTQDSKHEELPAVKHHPSLHHDQPFVLGVISWSVFCWPFRFLRRATAVTGGGLRPVCSGRMSGRRV